MDNELTEIEKAACYIQMLKQEGKLDEAALPELLQMYHITQEEAETLLASFKQTETYKSSVTDIIKEQLATLLCFVIFGLFSCLLVWVIVIIKTYLLYMACSIY